MIKNNEILLVFSDFWFLVPLTLMLKSLNITHWDVVNITEAVDTRFDVWNKPQNCNRPQLVGSGLKASSALKAIFTLRCTSLYVLAPWITAWINVRLQMTTQQERRITESDSAV